MKQIFVKTKHCLGCKSCEIACAVAHSKSLTLTSALHETPLPLPRVRVKTSQSARFVLMQCRHCKKPKCVAVCEYGAISKDIDYRTIIDETKCTGCFKCVAACPFGAMVVEKERRIVLVCDRCKDLGEPACVRACPTGVFTYDKLGKEKSYEEAH